MNKKSKQKFFRKFIFRLTIFSAIIILALFCYDFFLGTFYYARQNRVDAKYYNNIIGQDKIVALTFDDGPDPKNTPIILDILNKHEVKATFFLMGNAIVKNPDLVSTIDNSGHEIGNHTYTHSPDVHSSYQRMKLELDSTNKLISNITGKAPVLYRPPFLLDIGSDPLNDLNTPNQKMQWVSDLGYISVGADVDSLDWAVKTKEDLINNVVSGLEYGHIVLLHDGGEGKLTIEALDELIITLKDRGYEFSTVSEIIGLNAASQMIPTQDVSFGMRDEQSNGSVSALQRFLLKEGLFDHEVTGYFGPITKTALEKWQTNNQLEKELGLANSETRNKITNSLGNSNYSKPPASILNIPDISIERNLQLFYTKAFSETGKEIPHIMLVILVLVVFRMIAIFILFLLSFFKKRRVIKNPTRGVSVIIPAYNEQENVAATIQSVLNSEYDKFEIIIVDDGSTDKTFAIAKKIKNKFPKIITLLTQKNSGKAQALNFGIEHAKHNIVVTMDGDTIFHPQALAMLMRNFADKKVTAVAGRVYVAAPNNLISAFQHLEYMISQNIEKRAFGLLNAIGVVPGPIGAWRKKAILEAGGYQSDTLVEDQDLTLALLSKGKRIIYEPEAIAYTEAPHTISDFVKQRLRWVGGTLQCAWKYKFYLFNLKRPRIGFIILPNILVYTVLLYPFYPLMDIIFIIALFTTHWQDLVSMSFLFVGFDLIYTLLAAMQEKEKKKLLLLLPIQRFFYRFIVCYVVIKSLIRAIEGSDTFWNKVIKHGNTTGNQILAFNNMARAEVTAKPHRNR